MPCITSTRPSLGQARDLMVLCVGILSWTWLQAAFLLEKDNTKPNVMTVMQTTTIYYMSKVEKKKMMEVNIEDEKGTKTEKILNQPNTLSKQSKPLHSRRK
jgi:hypothetical protein